MTSAINFGNLSTTSGTPRLSGSASKLDTESILNATFEAARLPAVRLENRTTRNEERIAAFEDMRSLLANLRTAADGLRNPPGFFGAQNNAFETKQAFFSSSTAVPPGEIVGVAVSNRAAPGNFDLKVTQLATAEKLSIPGTNAANATLGEAWNGNVPSQLRIGLEGGTERTIDVDGGMTIYDLRDRINAERNTTGVRASVLKVADNDFRLVMTAEQTGKPITFNTLNDAPTVIAGAAVDARVGDIWNGGDPFGGELVLGLENGPTASILIDDDMTLEELRDSINAQSTSTGVNASIEQVSDNDFRLVLTPAVPGEAIILNGPRTTLQAAQPAVFEVDGVEITRLTNQADDILTGVTINLFKADPGTTINVSIEPSLGDIKERIAGFVGAYNDFREFVAQQSAVDSNGRPAPDAVLFGDRTMRGLVGGLGSVIGGGVTGLDPDALSSLRAIGIELDANNRLKVDDSKLDNALLTKLDDVRNIFEFRFQSSSSQLAVFARTNALAATDLTIEIQADADGKPETVTINGVAAELSGTTIKGAKGSPFEGLELLWTGQGDATIQVKVSQGIADRVFNFTGPPTDKLGGSITRAIDSLKDQNSNWAKQIERIEDRALRARDLLIERFTAMEAALSMAEMMMMQIRAQVDAMTADR